jgi:hypothetical protein
MDLLAEEATTSGEDGKILHVYSNNQRVKKILEELLYGRLDINANIYHWARNLVKYGDNFLYMLLDKKDGVKLVHQLINFNIERKEEIKDGKYIIKFRNKMDNTDLTAFEVAHFRLLGNDQYLPYGSSSFNKIRRTIRMLVMAEDAMLSYRLIRGADRRIIKVNVGNINDDDVFPYMMKVANQFKKSPIVDNGGNISYRFNVIDYSEDIVIPVRDNNSGAVVETLNGASNMDQIADVNFLRENLFTGLGIPKPFLGFDDAKGDGKNMAMLDVRFAKKVNRIQQALVQELNKICMIHLYLLGFEDEVANFRISLTNPSIQSDILKVEMLKEKVQVYKELTTPSDGGVAAWSTTKGKRELFAMSDDEIIHDLKQQYFEKAVVGEITQAVNKIKKTTLFDDIVTKFGSEDGGSNPDGEQGGDGQGGETPDNQQGIGGQNEPPVNEENILINKNGVLTEEMNQILKNLDKLNQKQKNTGKKNKK